ncbi:hypothetical protein [Burkholderia oklahomensis]|uniref:hypothetical protein n=1 Tax=Burkholderia oklahomensis TaxID=342113 RepID=UPI003AAD588D
MKLLDQASEFRGVERNVSRVQRRAQFRDACVVEIGHGSQRGSRRDERRGLARLAPTFDGRCGRHALRRAGRGRAADSLDLRAAFRT